MRCDEARELMSGYLEKSLTPSTSDRMAEHLAGCERCRSEVRNLAKTLRVIQSLPKKEPATDLWLEFSPKFAAIRAEIGESTQERTVKHLSDLWATVYEGWLIFCAVVSVNTRRTLRGYSLRDAG